MRQSSGRHHPWSTPPSEQGALRRPGLLLFSVGEAVRVGTGFDDGAIEVSRFHDSRAQARVGEGFGPTVKRFVGSDRNGVLLLPFGKDLKEEFRSVSAFDEAHVKVVVAVAPDADPACESIKVDELIG